MKRFIYILMLFSLLIILYSIFIDYSFISIIVNLLVITSLILILNKTKIRKE